MSERCETDKTPQAKANATDKFNSIARHNQRHCLFDNAATTNQAIFSAIFNSLLGGGRAWSAAVSCWQNGRIEALAMAPGIPSIADQEKRDRVPAGLYRKLVESGTLYVADNLRVPPVALLVQAIREASGEPASIVCDRFRLGELNDAAPGVPIVPRVVRWSEASFDIRALRKHSIDGPFSVVENSRPLIGASLAVALVKSDDQGSVRLIKRGSNNQARDDVAQAMTLAAGSYERSIANARRPRAVRMVVV